MKYVTGLAAALMAGFSLASAANAGELQDVSVVLSTNLISQPTTMTINYRTVTALSPGQILAVINTEGLVITNGPCSNGGVTLKLNNIVLPLSDLSHCSLYAGTDIQINTGSGLTVDPGTLVTLIFDSTRIRTGPTAGTYPLQRLATATGNGVTIDTKTPAPSITLVAAAPAPTPVPTLGEWAMILFGSLLAGVGALWVTRRKARLARV